MLLKHLGLHRFFKRARLLGLTAVLLNVGPLYGPVFSAPDSVTEKTSATERAEALIPLLEGRQEIWAIGEFVHLGSPAVPVLLDALNHPSRRVRLNALEAIYLIKDKSALSALNAVAANPKEIPAVREKALRVVIRLDPENAIPALQAMARDRDEAIRNTVVTESRQIKNNAVVELLISMLGDDAPSVADGALRTLYGFTGRLVERQDFLQSTKEQRVSWSTEWAQWWEANRDKFDLAVQGSQRRGF
jgi:hypothetical protein